MTDAAHSHRHHGHDHHDHGHGGHSHGGGHHDHTAGASARALTIALCLSGLVTERLDAAALPPLPLTSKAVRDAPGIPQDRPGA